MKAEFILRDDVPFFVFEGRACEAGTPPLTFDGKATDEHKKYFPAQWKAFVKENPQFMSDEEREKAARAEAMAANIESSQSEVEAVGAKKKRKSSEA